MPPANLHAPTVAAFGDEWAAFDQGALPTGERDELFNAYFSVFPLDSLTPQSEGFDLGCGSGRWAAMIAPRVGTLHCIDPAAKALDVARRNVPGARFHLADAENIPLADDSQDFGFALGVLHHVPDTAAALASCVRKLKRGSPFLLYVYYAFDNRPGWYRWLWRGSDFLRSGVCRLPQPLKRTAADLLALTIYWPLSRLSRAFGPHFPLHAYRDRSLYTLRTDALDRFGTHLEQRFTREGVKAMMRDAGLTDIHFSDSVPFWTACGYRS